MLSLLVPHAYVSVESIDFILLSSFELKAILLITPVKRLCFSLLSLHCVLVLVYFFTNPLILSILIFFL